MAYLNKKQEYKGYEIEIIRGKNEALVLAVKDGFQLSSREANAKLALKAVKVKIDERDG